MEIIVIGNQNQFQPREQCRSAEMLGHNVTAWEGPLSSIRDENRVFDLAILEVPLEQRLSALSDLQQVAGITKILCSGPLTDGQSRINPDCTNDTSKVSVGFEWVYHPRWEGEWETFKPRKLRISHPLGNLIRDLGSQMIAVVLSLTRDFYNYNYNIVKAYTGVQDCELHLLHKPTDAIFDLYCSKGEPEVLAELESLKKLGDRDLKMLQMTSVLMDVSKTPWKMGVCVDYLCDEWEKFQLRGTR